MPHMRARRLSFVVTAALACCVALVSCLQPLESTPESSLVSITPVSPFIRGLDSDYISRFEITFHVQNPGARTLYVDATHRRIEKLVDQKWEVAMESAPAPFVAFRSIPPNQRVSVSFIVRYDRRTDPDWVLLQRIRGLYRARLRLAFTPDGSDAVPPEDSYSQPFAVTE